MHITIAVDATGHSSIAKLFGGDKFCSTSSLSEAPYLLRRSPVAAANNKKKPPLLRAFFSLWNKDYGVVVVAGGVAVPVAGGLAAFGVAAGASGNGATVVDAAGA